MIDVGLYSEIGTIVVTDPMRIVEWTKDGLTAAGWFRSRSDITAVPKTPGGKLFVSFSQKGFGGFDPDKGFGAGIVFGEIALMTACRSAIEREGSRMYRSEGLKKKSQSSRDLPEPH